MQHDGELFKTFQQAPVGSPLYKKGMLRGQEGQFEYDAINDKLPAVSWIICTSFQSEHPDYMPADGAAFVASKIDAIAANPDVWAKTLFILNYDENDGIFDHVPPPVPKDGTPHEFIDGVPIGAGFRVPCILISPWTATADMFAAIRSITPRRFVFLEKTYRRARAKHHRLAAQYIWRHDLGAAI